MKQSLSDFEAYEAFNRCFICCEHLTFINLDGNEELRLYAPPTMCKRHLAEYRIDDSLWEMKLPIPYKDLGFGEEPCSSRNWSLRAQ